MAYFTHQFDAEIALHPVGTYNYTVVYLPASIASELPFESSPRLRVEADLSGVQVKGAWQPASGRWYLMLPKKPLKDADLKIGSRVEVSFRLLPQDQVDLPAELAQLLQAMPKAQIAWKALSAGKQRALAHLVGSAKLAQTRSARLKQVQDVLLGLAPPPWIKSRQRTVRGDA
jgi:antitoxin component of MazEF toxin-antitoxin module